MVSIVERSSYISELRKNPKVNCLFGFLFGSSSKDYGDDNFSQIIKSLERNDKVKFNQIYKELNSREPSNHLPYVHDDFLLFSLILGCKKFNIDLSWVKRILSVRSTTDVEGNLITISLINIIENNFLSQNNNFGIILSFESILNQKYTSWQERKLFYIDIIKEKFPFYSSDLLNLLALKAYDIVILEGDESRESKYNRLSSFETSFLNRINNLSKVLHWTLNLLLICLLLYFYVNDSSFKSLLTDNSVIVSILGLGGIAAQVIFNNKVSKGIRYFLYWMWGYNH